MPSGGQNKLTREMFFKKASLVHDKYDYSFLTQEWWDENYIGLQQTTGLIICPEHGEFPQVLRNHLDGNGCQKCANINGGLKNRLTLDEFLSKVSPSYLYDLSLITQEFWDKNYNNTKTKVPIICASHGEFFQQVGNILRKETGCPKCSETLGEKKIRAYLEENNIDFQTQYKIENGQRYDFYIAGTMIEFDGEQHFMPVDFSGKGSKFAEEQFKDVQKRDALKNQYCVDNDIKLIRIPYWDIHNIDTILSLEEF